MLDLSLFGGDGLYVVGVSGGVDSMFMFHRLCYYLGKDRLVVAHVNHGFRDESVEEYAFVKKVCDDRGVTFRGITLNIPSIIVSGDSTQDVCRKHRYDFYYDVFREFSADGLVLGHHGDDLIETVLMKQISGAFGSSSIGMVGSRVDDRFNVVLRPMLGMSKSDIYNAASELGVEWREDLSNTSDYYMRNRIRHHVIDRLKEENENVHLNFWRVAEERAEEERFFDRFVDSFLQEDVMTVDGMLKISTKSLIGLDGVIRKRVLRKLVSMCGDVVFSRSIESALLDLLHADHNGSCVEIVRGMYIVIMSDYMYVFGDDVKESLRDRGENLSNSLCGDDCVVARLSNSHRLGNGKRVVKFLKERKVPTYFRNESWVILCDGVTHSVIVGGTVLYSSPK